MITKFVRGVERNMDYFSLFRDRHNFYWQELGDQLGN